MQSIPHIPPKKFRQRYFLQPSHSVSLRREPDIAYIRLTFGGELLGRPIPFAKANASTVLLPRTMSKTPNASLPSAHTKNSERFKQRVPPSLELDSNLKKNGVVGFDGISISVTFDKCRWTFRFYEKGGRLALLAHFGNQIKLPSQKD